MHENNNVFIIPCSLNEYIIYLPLHGILIKGNASYVALLDKALQGDAGAQKKIGLSPDQVSQILTRRLKDETSSKEFKPTALTLFLTTQCSMSCNYCYARGGDKSIQIKREYIHAALKEVIQNAIEQEKQSIRVAYHGGGDIGVVWSLVEETTDYIRYQTGRNDLDVTFTAGLNGILNKYQRKWITQNMHSATVSIDGFSFYQNISMQDCKDFHRNRYCLHHIGFFLFR